MDIKKIFSSNMAHKLCEKGFKVIGTEGNNIKPWLYVFLFEDTPEFRDAMTEISNEMKCS